MEENIITIIHDELGLSDNDIAYVGKFTRTYITLVRHGKRHLSTQAHNRYVEIYHALKQAHYIPSRAKYGSKKKEKLPRVERLPLPVYKFTAPTAPSAPTVTAQHSISKTPQYTAPSAPSLKYQKSLEQSQYTCAYCNSSNRLQSYVINNTSTLLCVSCIKRYEDSICSVCGFSQESTSIQIIDHHNIRICGSCLYRVKHNLIRLHL